MQLHAGLHRGLKNFLPVVELLLPLRRHLASPVSRAPAFTGHALVDRARAYEAAIKQKLTL